MDSKPLNKDLSIELEWVIGNKTNTRMRIPSISFIPFQSPLRRNAGNQVTPWEVCGNFPLILTICGKLCDVDECGKRWIEALRGGCAESGEKERSGEEPAFLAALGRKVLAREGPGKAALAAGTCTVWGGCLLFATEGRKEQCCLPLLLACLPPWRGWGRRISFIP